VLGAYADGRGNRLVVEQKDEDEVVDLSFLTGLSDADLSVDPDAVVDTESADRILTSVARSYYDDAPLSTCSICGDSEALLLGSLTRAGGDPAWRAADFERGPMVYNNDMLYAAVTRHATDYGNPHQVGLALSDSDGAAVIGVEGLQRGDGVVRVASANDALSIDTDDGTVTFTVEASGGAAPDLTGVRNRLSALERHALEKALRCNLVSFAYLTERFPGEMQSVQNAIQNVVDSVEAAVNNPDTFEDANSYITATNTILQRQRTLHSRVETPGAGLPSVASQQSRDRYEDALDRLTATTGGDDPLAVATAHECAGKAAELLVPTVGSGPHFGPSFAPAEEVTVIDSLGDHYQNRLEEVRGVTTLEDLADLSDDDIAEIADEIDRLSEDRLREWVLAARKRLDRD
jgi:predicted flap endonuclease-1-like 5' DNA nuclease